MQYPSNINLLLHLADNALILGHRNSEWTGHGPILEQDIAISNIALDLVGHARNFYQEAAKNINQHSPSFKSNLEFDNDAIHKKTGLLSRKALTEDDLAYFRDPPDFLNLLIVEQPKNDWAFTILRQFLVAAFQQFYFEQLLLLRDTGIAAIAEKSLKEIQYHIKWSGEWVIRLGDGTVESRTRLLHSLEQLWPFTAEFFQPALFESDAGIDLTQVERSWQNAVMNVFEKATILNEYSNIQANSNMVSGGKEGNHTPFLKTLLNEMQVLQRTYPGASW